MRETLVKTEEFKDSPLGKIPADWEVLTFEDVSTVRQGLQIAISRRFKDYKPGRYIYITVEYLNNIANSHLLEFIESPGNRVICHQDDVLVTRTGATGKIITDVEGVFHNNFFLVDYDRSKVNRDYLVCYLNLEQIQKEIKLRAGTTTIPDLKHRDFYSLTFLRPSLAEQEKIAVILKSCDETIAHTSSLIAKLKQMKAGLLHDLLTRGLDENGELRDAIGHPEQFKDSPLGQIPKNWKFTEFGALIAEGPQNGIYKPESDYADNAVPIVRIDGFYDGVLANQESFRRVRLTEAEIRRYALNKEDILINRVNSIDFVGKSAIVSGITEATVFESNIMRLVLKRELILPAYAIRLICFFMQRQLRSQSKSAIAQASINQYDVRSCIVAIPSVEEQAQIVERIDTLDTRIRTEEAYRDKLKLQKKGLMHDLLTGKVRVKDADKFTSASDTV